MRPTPLRSADKLLDADGVVQELSHGWLSTVERVCGDPQRTADFLKAFYATEAMFMAGEEGVGAALAELVGAWNASCTMEEAMQLWWSIVPHPDMFTAIAAVRAHPPNLSHYPL